MSVRTYKSLDYPVKLYGFWPGDLAAVFLVFLIAHGAFNRLLLDVVIVGPLLYAAWRGRRRPALYVASLLSFAARHGSYGVALSKERTRR